MERRPFVVGLGGTTRAGSSSEKILLTTLSYLAAGGAATEAFVGQDLLLPLYEPEAQHRSSTAHGMIEAIKHCDAVVIASPGYHGSISGMVKNALDYMEDLRDDPRPYLTDRAVGCIACAYGWQAANSTLAALRSVTHSLRGWPTPLGVAINSSVAFGPEEIALPEVSRQLQILAQQLLQITIAKAPTVA